MSKHEIITLDTGAPKVDFRALFQTPIDEMDGDTQVVAYAASDLVEKVLKDRKGKLKDTLKERITAEGEQATAQTKRLSIDLGGVVLDLTSSKPPLIIDQGKLRALLAEKNIDEDRVFDKVPVLNEPRLEALIALGDITAAELKAITLEGPPRSPSLKVKKHPFGLTKRMLLNPPE